MIAGMKGTLAALIALGAAAFPAVAVAEDALQFQPPVRSGAAELPPYMECVPFARAFSGIEIYGDAWTWWDKAEGVYQKGRRPQAGAVLAFVPHGNMRLGHVAAVSRVIDSRTVLLTHANWSPINGRRGQIERDVKAVDVSPANDWSEVRVWYAPTGDLGTTAWPTQGFIYPKVGKRPAARAATTLAAAPAPSRHVLAAPAPQAVQPVRRESSARFTAAFADLSATSVARPAARPAQAARVTTDLFAEYTRRR